jgi:hypothetical protein
VQKVSINKYIKLYGGAGKREKRKRRIKIVYRQAAYPVAKAKK